MMVRFCKQDEAWRCEFDEYLTRSGDAGSALEPDGERAPIACHAARGRSSLRCAYLSAYVARGEARPAYKRAFDAQLAANTGKPSRG